MKLIDDLKDRLYGKITHYTVTGISTRKETVRGYVPDYFGHPMFSFPFTVEGNAEVASINLISEGNATSIDFIVNETIEPVLQGAHLPYVTISRDRLSQLNGTSFDSRQKQAEYSLKGTGG
ncbi:MAG: hypothetical protein HGA85_03275 [Nanoarchaeota archaeon]|nr:hypothetical protein [Nanoarchaeota archaeon]